MNKTLIYLYDPLCGWCYGSTAALSRVLQDTGIPIELLPTGLFAGTGARNMDAEFAHYAWSNDQRIAALTGQPFSEVYRETVLGDSEQRFDSGPATLALTAVALAAPAREFEALKTIQHARYVDAVDITQRDVLGELLADLGLPGAAAELQKNTAALRHAMASRISRGQELMRAAGSRGVPTLLLRQDERMQRLDSGMLYGAPDALEALLRD